LKKIKIEPSWFKKKLKVKEGVGAGGHRKKN
jgi:hypothetical protein